MLGTRGLLNLAIGNSFHRAWFRPPRKKQTKGMWQETWEYYEHVRNWYENHVTLQHHMIFTFISYHFYMFENFWTWDPGPGPKSGGKGLAQACPAGALGPRPGPWAKTSYKSMKIRRSKSENNVIVRWFVYLIHIIVILLSHSLSRSFHMFCICLQNPWKRVCEYQLPFTSAIRDLLDPWFEISWFVAIRCSPIAWPPPQLYGERASPSPQTPPTWIPWVRVLPSPTDPSRLKFMRSWMFGMFGMFGMFRMFGIFVIFGLAGWLSDLLAGSLACWLTD